MKNYTKTYMAFFGYTVADFIACEICESRAVDIHHIYARSISRGKVNDIFNLMALCRMCHEKYVDKKEKRDFLLAKHSEKMRPIIFKK